MSDDYKLSSEEFMDLSKALEQHHAVFYKLWTTGEPFYDESIPTAAVYFDAITGDEINFAINKEFWETLSFPEKCFVISHECLHIVLNHGFRSLHLPKTHAEIINIAQDFVVNHALVNLYGFVREEIDPENKYFWVDKLPPQFGEVPDNESFEYYYNLLQELTEEQEEEVKGSGESPDSHENLEDASSINEELNDSLSDDEKETLKDLIEKECPEEISRGSSGTGTWQFANVEPVKKKRKWESVINKWAMKRIKKTETEYDQWAILDRRYSLLPRNMFIPSTFEVEDVEEEEDRIEVWFFQDTSGSCYGYFNRFFKAAKSLPPEKFSVRLFAFSMVVDEVDMKEGKLPRGGGTSFYIIEREIQNIVRSENIEYPKAVFVITDGMGDFVRPQYPERWYWFLTDGYNFFSQRCIPKESNTYNLRDFE